MELQARMGIHLWIIHILFCLNVKFISVFNQLEAQNLFQNKFYFVPIYVLSICARDIYRHEIKLIVKQILCIKLVKYRDKYTEMHGQQNVKI